MKLIEWFYFFFFTLIYLCLEGRQNLFQKIDWMLEWNVINIYHRIIIESYNLKRLNNENYDHSKFMNCNNNK